MVDFFSIETLKVVGIAILAFGGLYLFRNVPGFRAALPFFKWVIELVRRSLNYWGARKVYKDSADVAARYTVMLDMFKFQPGMDLSKLWFGKFVKDTYIQLVSDGHSEDEALRIANGVYVLLSYHPDILTTLSGLSDIKHIDVKKTTLLFVDFLGELFNLKHKLDRLFYQDMVYGVNQVLLELKNGKADKKTVSAVTGTLWRMYQLSKAYGELKNNSSLSQAEFQKKMQTALSTLISYFYK